MINSYGVKVGLRTYDSGELNPYRRQNSGINGKNGRWEVRYDPYDISRVWVRNHHRGGWLTATWTHLRTAPVPFGEPAWTHARQIVAAHGSDPATEAEIAAAAADLLNWAGKGPGPGQAGRVRRGRARQRVARRQHGPGGSPGVPRRPLPRNGPAQNPPRPAARTKPPPVARQASPPTPSPRRRK